MECAFPKGGQPHILRIAASGLEIMVVLVQEHIIETYLVWCEPVSMFYIYHYSVFSLGGLRQGEVMELSIPVLFPHQLLPLS